MEETNQNTILKWAVGIILTIGVITSGVYLYNKSKPSLEKAGTQLDTITIQMENSSYTAYDGKIVSGSEVISVINTKASDSVEIKVITKSNSNGVSYDSASYNISDIADTNYIEPTGTFVGSVGTTTNGTINSITFKQQ